MEIDDSSSIILSNNVEMNELDEELVATITDDAFGTPENQTKKLENNDEDQRDRFEKLKNEDNILDLFRISLTPDDSPDTLETSPKLSQIFNEADSVSSSHWATKTVGNAAQSPEKILPPPEGTANTFLSKPSGSASSGVNSVNKQSTTLTGEKKLMGMPMAQKGPAWSHGFNYGIGFISFLALATLTIRMRARTSHILRRSKSLLKLEADSSEETVLLAP